MYDVDDTIVGIASAPGGAIRGVIRLSGPHVIDALQRCFRHTTVALGQVSQSQVIEGQLQLNPPLAALPGELYLWPTRQSYTRQPSAEFHTIGSPPLLEAAVATFCQSGVRLAQPGEFTLRAFLAGRLDLPQAEAVLGVIDAQGRDELDVALGQLAGGLSAPLNELRNDMLELLAHLEAGLDFVEEDIEFISTSELVATLQAASIEVRKLATQLTGRGQTESETRIAITGWPNVGKSSLFNALVDGRPALVSDVAGTTRDYLTARMPIGDQEVVLVDTAGVDSAESGIAAAAQRMTDDQSSQAQLRLFCVDATRPLNDGERKWLDLHEHSDALLVLTKCDGHRATDLQQSAIETSSHSGLGLGDLKHAVSKRLTNGVSGQSVVPSTAARCRASFQSAALALETAHATASAEAGEELVAAEIRHALDQLGTVVGTVYTDDILDKIFSRFCIGK
jgi:tRNA modification GTPase